MGHAALQLSAKPASKALPGPRSQAPDGYHDGKRDRGHEGPLAASASGERAAFAYRPTRRHRELLGGEDVVRLGDPGGIVGQNQRLVPQ
jgi:hypothetical protein